MKTKRIAAIAVALLMAFTVLPAAAAADTLRSNQKLALADLNPAESGQVLAFLEQTDGSGVKNGVKMNADYDSGDPDTWGAFSSEHWEAEPDGLNHLTGVCIEQYDLAGQLDLNGFEYLCDLAITDNAITALDVSGCRSLTTLECSGNALVSLNAKNCGELGDILCNDNALTSLNIVGCETLYLLECANNELDELDCTGCVMLEMLNCSGNALTALELAGCESLVYLDCSDNALTSLDLADQTLLEELNASGNEFTSLDLSSSHSMAVNTITAEGSGTVGYMQTGREELNAVLYAYAADGAEFLGWYNSEDELLSEDAEWDVSQLVGSIPSGVTAKFGTASAGLKGDLNEDGSVSAIDALMALRIAMGGSTNGVSEQGLLNGDMDDDGSISAVDALSILRIAMS